MLFLVNGEVVTAGEGALTVVALERPVSGVFSVVSRQFVGPRELPLAAGPVTHVWSQSGVCAHVLAQVRHLAVRLGAADVRTDVLWRCRCQAVRQP